MTKQLSVILWLIVFQLLFSTGFGDYARTPTGIGSSSGRFNSEEASRDAYAAPKSNRFPDSSALRRSDRADVVVDVDSDSIPEFNEPVGLQAEAQDARTPTGIESSSGRFNSEEASRDAYAAPKSNGFPDSSALRRSDRADVIVDVDSDSIPEFNEPVGLQAEAQDARTPTGIGSSSGRFNSEGASRDAYAAPISNRFPDSSALRRSDRADVVVDVDSDSIPEFNEPVGLQAEAQDGGVMMLPNFNGERDDENSEEYVEVRRRRFSSGAQDVITYGILSSLLAVSHSEVPGLESGRRRLSLSSGALDVVAYERWSSLRVVSDSEVPALESGRQRWSTPGAGTSSQVVRSSNQRQIDLGIGILVGSIAAVVSIGVGELPSRNRFILNCVLVISAVGVVSLAAAFMTDSSTPSTDTYTTQTANTILARLGFAASAFGLILVIAMGLPDNLLWVIVLALIALVFIIVKTSLARRPRI